VCRMIRLSWGGGGGELQDQSAFCFLLSRAALEIAFAIIIAIAWQSQHSMLIIDDLGR
jgi:hypothetical protein